MIKQQNDLMIAKDAIISLLRDAYGILNGKYTQGELARDIATVEKRSNNEGLSFFTRTLPNISKGLLDHLEGRESNFSNFSKSRHGYPSFLKGIFRLAYTDCVCQTDAIRLIYQVGDGFKKLNGPFISSELDEQLNTFIETDRSLVITPSEDDPILVLARSYVTTIFKNVDATFKDGLIPRPGPGATNNPLKLTQRYQPNQIFDNLDEVFNTQEWFYPTYWEGSWDRANLIQLYKKSQVEPSARFKFVPKKVGTARGICIEFNEMQYLQQGLKDFLYKHLERHWLTRDEIHFSDQRFNQSLARSSSIDKEYATLDMKDGSNRVSRSVVEFLFSRLPEMSEVLSALSTRLITFDDLSKSLGGKIYKPLRTNMFAPMGSGICFPIMSLVHYALIKAIQTYVHNAPHDHFLVYGDDLIVKTEYVSSLFEIMPKYGMKFNENKSFSRGFFRESCGLHAFMNEDVTPIYFKYMSNNSNPKAVMSIIKNESMAMQKGYYSLASFMRMQQEKINLFVPENSNIVGWKRPIFKVEPLNDGVTCKVRWSSDWQRSERRLPTFHVEKQGSTPRMPRSWVTTVLTRKQIKSFIAGTNWNEHTAYLRSLLVSSEDHAHHWDNTGIIKYRHSWV